MMAARSMRGITRLKSTVPVGTLFHGQKETSAVLFAEITDLSDIVTTTMAAIQNIYDR